MESVITENKNVYIEIENDKAIIASAASFFQKLATSVGMESSQALYLRFALEDLFNFIFSFLMAQEEGTERIQIQASFEKDALCLAIHETGIPILAEEVPDITVEDLLNEDFQPPTLLDQPETVYNGFGIHFIKKMLDEFSMLHTHGHKYYEIRIKQYFIRPTRRLSPVLPEVAEESIPMFSVENEKIDLGNNYVLKRLDTLEEAIQVIRGLVETYGYSMYEYNSITDVNDYLSMINKGTYFPYIVVGENNRVIHHFAYHQCSYNPHYIEHCHLFARPLFRGEVNPIRIIDEACSLPLVQNYEGIFALAMTLHIVSQLGALRNGTHITGFIFFNFHVELRSTHRETPDFYCLVEMHKTIHPRNRELYVPCKYQEFVQSVYAELELPVIFKKPDEDFNGMTGQSQFIIEMDNSLCYSLVLLHPRTGDWENIRKAVSKIRRKGIKILRISISAEEPGCIELADRLYESDFIFTGISPINDLLVFHYFNGMDIDFNQIKLVHDFGRPLLKYIETEYNRIFPS